MIHTFERRPKIASLSRRSVSFYIRVEFLEKTADKTLKV